MRGLRFIRRELFPEAASQSHHAWRTVFWIEQHVENVELALVREGSGQSLFKLSLGADA